MPENSLSLMYYSVRPIMETQLQNLQSFIFLSLDIFWNPTFVNIQHTECYLFIAIFKLRDSFNRISKKHMKNVSCNSWQMIRGGKWGGGEKRGSTTIWVRLARRSVTQQASCHVMGRGPLEKWKVQITLGSLFRLWSMCKRQMRGRWRSQDTERSTNLTEP